MSQFLASALAVALALSLPVGAVALIFTPWFQGLVNPEGAP